MPRSTPTAPPPDPRPRTLVVHDDSGAAVHALVPGRVLVIGRAAEAELTVSGLRVSRQHARLEISDAGEAHIRDLGSTNGTRVNGEPVDAARLRPGDVVALGSVLLRLTDLDPGQAQVLLVEEHEDFARALGAELQRSRSFDRGGALVLLQPLEATGRERLLPLWAAVRALLRPADRLGRFGPQTVEVLLPEVQAGEALGFCERVRSLPDAVPLGCGVACWPQAGSTPSGILAAARSALERATSASPIQQALEALDELSTLLGSDPPEAPEADHRLLIQTCECAIVREAVARTATQAEAARVLQVSKRTLGYKLDVARRPDAVPVAQARAWLAEHTRPGEEALGLRERIAVIEHRLLERAVERSDGDLTRAAARLGMHRRTLALKLKRGGADG